MESNYVNLLIYYHDLWLKNNCNPKCSDKKIKEKIEFYDKQPIQYSLFQSVIFQKDILIPYSNKSLKDCIEYEDCKEIIGKHNISFEITFSKANPILSEKINEVVIENRDILFSKYIDGHFLISTILITNNLLSISAYFNQFFCLFSLSFHFCQ